MIAVDTNVLVRMITRDDPEQAAAAAAALTGQSLWIPKTVLLELEWVLRYCYELDRQSVQRALSSLVRLRRAMIEDRSCVELAIGLHEHGMDLADALHLASSACARTFVTFDRKLVKKAPTQADLPGAVVLGPPVASAS